MTNGNGMVTDTYAYTAFGELRQQTGTTPNTYLYTGQQVDALTGLYSLRARYYAPNMGRFLSADKWAVDVHNPVELNRYVYAVNNPVRWGDPSGYTSLGEYGLIDTGSPSVAITAGELIRGTVTLINSTPLVAGGFQGAIGYILGLSWYNLVEIKKNVLDALDGWSWEDFVSAVAMGVTIDASFLMPSYVFGNLAKTPGLSLWGGMMQIFVNAFIASQAIGLVISLDPDAYSTPKDKSNITILAMIGAILQSQPVTKLFGFGLGAFATVFLNTVTTAKSAENK